MSTALEQEVSPEMVFQTAKPDRRKIRQYWDMITNLIWRDVQIRYRRSVLGILWSFINPLLFLLILNFVFQQVLPLKIPNYATYLFCGLLAWNWFSTTIQGANYIILSNRDLVRKPRFATETLVLVNVTAQLVNYVLTLPVLFGLLLISGIGLHWSVLWLPVIILVQFLFTLGLAFLLAALNVYLRDMEYLSSLGILLWFYLTPVFYDPKGIAPDLAWVFEVNPMAQLMINYRAILIYNSAPDFANLGKTALVAGFICLLGWLIFRKIKYGFVDEL